MEKSKLGVFLVVVAVSMISVGSYFTYDMFFAGDNVATNETNNNNDNDKDKDKDKEDNTDGKNENNDSILLESKKSTFLMTAANAITAVSVKVNFGELALTDVAKAYYVPVSDISEDSCVALESGGRSPFGAWDYAYVVVTLSGDGTFYQYMFTAKDEAGYYMPSLKEIEWSTIDVKSDWTEQDAPTPFNGEKVVIDDIERTIEIIDVEACKQ